MGFFLDKKDQEKVFCSHYTEKTGRRGSVYLGVDKEVDMGGGGG